MLKRKGIYLIPVTKQKFDLLYCNGKEYQKLYSDSFANELVSMIDTDADSVQIALSYIDWESVKNKSYSTEEAEEIITMNFKVAYIIKVMNTALGLLLETELSKIERPSPDVRKGYERVLSAQKKIFDDFTVAYNNTRFTAIAYAELDCPLAEKTERITRLDDSIYDRIYQEGYFVKIKPDFIEEQGLTRFYFFDSASNYLDFLLFQMIILNPNICMCQNCGKLFAAKTKKRTLYCSRIQPDTNKKCSEIGPKIRAERQSSLFGYEDYEKAVNQNYQRARRTEENYARDVFLDWKDYYSWLERAQIAKKQWQNGEISNEEFLQIVHELD